METAFMSPFTGILILLFFFILAAGLVFPIWFWVSLRRHIREKTRPRVISLVFLGLGLLALLLFATLSILDKNGISLYFFGRVSKEWTGVLEHLFPLFLGVGCLLFSPRKLASVPTVAGGAFLTVLLLTVYMGLSPWKVDLHKTTLTSPDTLSEPHEIVVVERYYLFTGRSVVYERVSPYILRKLGEYHSYDGWLLVYEGNYTVDWREEGFTLSCYRQSETFLYSD